MCKNTLKVFILDSDMGHKKKLLLLTYTCYPTWYGAQEKIIVINIFLLPNLLNPQINRVDLSSQAANSPRKLFITGGNTEVKFHGVE